MVTNSLDLVQALSQTLIAFTIEYDNDWEQRFWIESQNKPLRVSMVMWENFLRFVPPDGISLRELSAKAGYRGAKAHPSTAGMLRWGYITASEGATKRKGKLDQIIRTTEVGRQAANLWEPLAGEIERRWCARFGTDEIDELKEALVNLIAQFDIGLPRYFPVLGHLHGMRAHHPTEIERDPPQSLSLPNLLSMAVHRYTLSFEEGSDISLAHRSNILRVLTTDPIATKLVPTRAGVSKEALQMAYRFLSKSGHLVVATCASGRGKVVRLTEQGEKERERYGTLHRAMERQWEMEFSPRVVSRLRASLAPFHTHDVTTESPLFGGLSAPADTWRAGLPKRQVLPHHPMVLHRGGWPDGS